VIESSSSGLDARQVNRTIRAVHATLPYWRRDAMCVWVCDPLCGRCRPPRQKALHCPECGAYNVFDVIGSSCQPWLLGFC